MSQLSTNSVNSGYPSGSVSNSAYGRQSQHTESNANLHGNFQSIQRGVSAIDVMASGIHIAHPVNNDGGPQTSATGSPEADLDQLKHRFSDLRGVQNANKVFHCKITERVAQSPATPARQGTTSPLPVLSATQSELNDVDSDGSENGSEQYFSRERTESTEALREYEMSQDYFDRIRGTEQNQGPAQQNRDMQQQNAASTVKTATI